MTRLCVVLSAPLWGGGCVSALFPGFALGFLALGIPIVLHLWQLRRSRVVVFPSLRLLQLVHIQVARRRRVHEWLLLAFRLLLLAAVVAMLMGLVWRGDSSTGASSSETTMVILLDDSAGMGVSAGDRSAWQQARQAARALLDSLAPGDEACLALFSRVLDNPRLGAPTANLDRLRRTLDAWERPSLGSASPAGLWEAATEALEHSSRTHRELCLITDMRRAPWQGIAGRGGDAPESARVFVIDAGVESGENLALGSLEITTPLITRHAPLELSGIVRRTTPQGDAGGRDLTVRVFVDGLPVTAHSVALVNREAAFSVDLSLDKPGRRVIRCDLDSPDALAADNTAFQTVTVVEALRVLLVRETQAQRREDDPAFYLGTALHSDGRDDTSEGFFSVTLVTEAELAQAALDPFAVVALLNPAPPSPELAERLRVYLTRGGSLAVFPGGRSTGDNTGLAPPAASAWPDWLPARFSDPVRLDPPRPPTISLAGHPFWRRMRAFPPRLFSQPTFSRLFPVQARAGTATLVMVGEHPALTLGRVERGAVLTAGFGADDRDGTLPFHALYVPLMQEAFRYLAGTDRDSARPLPTQTVIEVPSSAGSVIARPPNGHGRTLPVNDDRSPARLLLDEPGLWLLERERQDAETGNAWQQPLLVNFPGAQSPAGPGDRLDEAALRRLLGLPTLYVLPAAGDVSAALRKQRIGWSWSGILFAAALAFFALESVLALRLLPSPQAPPGFQSRRSVNPAPERT